MANSKHFVQFDELEAELDEIMTRMAREFFKIDPAQKGGDVKEFDEFSLPYSEKFITRLRELETDHDENVIHEEFSAVIDEFDTVDRAVYAKTDQQEPEQGIAVLVAEHRTKIMQMLQEKDEGYQG